MDTRFSLALLAAISLSTTGCYTTWDIAPRNVSSLHTDPELGKVMIANNGDFVPMDRDTEMRFTTTGGPDLDVKFESLDVAGGPASPRKEWWAGGVLRGDGRGMRVDMREVTAVVAKRYSPGKTAALVAGLVAGATALVTISVVAVVASINASSD